MTQEDLVPPRSRLRSRVLLFAALLLAIAATLRLAGSAAFAVDPDLGRFAAGSAKQQHHNCFTGYVIAAYLASRTQRAVYDPKNYRGTSDPTPVHEGIGRRFSIDSFPYPPQFLLLPVGLLQISSSFLTLRAIWFVLCVSVLATGLIVSAFWAGGTRRPSWLWLLPGGVLVANGVIFTLQIGNVHPIVVSLSVLAMIVFERRNAWALAFGGAILSFAILTKLWPATLLLYLLFRRRFAAVGATLGWCALWSLVTWLTLGGHVFSEFFNDQLPALASGAAFPFAFHIPQAIVTSAALVSIPAKLHWLGLLAATPAMMPAWIVWPNTVLLVFLVVWAARMHDTRSVSRTTRLATWLAILTLVQLRSPFLPSAYAFLTFLWMLPCLAAEGSRLTQGLAATAFVLIALPLTTDLTARAWLMIAGCLTMLVVSIVVLARKPRPRKNVPETFLRDVSSTSTTA